MLRKRLNFCLSILISILVSILVPGPSFPQGLPSAKSEDVGMSTARLERIRPVMQAYVDEGKVPGMITAGAIGQRSATIGHTLLNRNHPNPLCC